MVLPKYSWIDLVIIIIFLFYNCNPLHVGETYDPKINEAWLYNRIHNTHTHSSTSSLTYMKVCFLPKKLPPTSVGLILPANIKFNTTCKAKAEYSIIDTF